MSTAPSNQFHQLNLTGGYKFDKTTKLVAAVAYSRNTQNDAFLPERMEGATAAVAQPATSLNGVVVTKSVNLKLTSRPIKDLGLMAAYKYDDRDTRTPTKLYSWQHTDTQTAGAAATAYNWAYSKKLSQLNLEADWAFQKGQAVKLGLEQQKINRRCDSGVWASASGCVNSADHTERTTSIDYRNTMLEAITAKLGYAASSRKVSDYTLGSASLTANNNPNSQGPLTRFSMSDRERDKLRVAVTWQATPELELTAGYDYNKDRYATGKGQYLLSTLKDVGLKTADSDVFNLDGSYRVSDAVSVNAFYSREDRSSKLQGNAGRGATFTAASDWRVDMKEKVDTYGFGFKAAVSGKWDLAGDYIRTEAKLPFDLFAASQSAFNTTTSAQTANAFANYGFSDTFEKSDTLKFNAKYTMDKTSSWRFGYSYQKLSSADPLRYTGLQTGTATSVLAGSGTAAVNGVAVPATNVYTAQQLVPTNEQAPNYTVHSVAVTYIYSFK
jgi:MtrB/PioB family decaheme-associated outer membrane protein